MRKLLRSPSVWAAALLLATFWVTAFIVPSHELIELLRIVQTSVSVAVVVAYATHAMDGLRAPWPDRIDQLSMGITIGFISIAFSGLWFLLWRLSDKPPWMLDGKFAAFLIYLTILAGALHITAPGALSGQIPRRNKILLGLGVGAGMLVALIVLWLQPNLQPIAAFLEEWTP